ncbi:PTPLA-domain-containing protein [Laetiporus sulphureus 93-53]|uniref:Very-long-chain (3R)-3-hydroxyacyl-CoA dehydratase n=1 Tax=Laetiporus sulphureus 93-53 TaxID=1314785 RepID=A0A165GSC5_9APHY|nr:PTPLA-domain-containing protein [Laetiporus sulphureus 93-53]KZT10740.1 PTPLA-domain-containing protein [Laetiporus sulphureus 93-53]
MSQSEERGKSAGKTKKGPSTLVKYYLVAYNVFSALGWSYVLIITVAHLLGLDASVPASASPSRIPILSTLASYLPTLSLLKNPSPKWEKQVPSFLIPVLRRASTTYAVVGPQTAIVQSFAVLEVLHSLLGWVRSPVGTTIAQVASRFYLVWGITAQFEQTRSHPLYASMVFSWSVAEVVRYSFYACSLLGYEPRALLWVRYTFFYVLYLTGAGSEAGLIYASLPAPPPSIPFLSAEWAGWLLPLSWPFATARWAEVLHDDFRVFMFLVWWPGLYVLYAYMIKQRRKVLGKGPGGTIGSKPKSFKIQ